MSRFELADLPAGSGLRKRAVAAYAAAENQAVLPAGASVVGSPARVAANSTTAPRARGRPYRFQCVRCGVQLASYAALARHDDEYRHARYECVLEGSAHE